MVQIYVYWKQHLMIETKDINKIRNAVRDLNALIYVLPTEDLKKFILNGGDPVISSLPVEASTMFLEGKGMAVENDMIIKWLDGNIDAKNKRILDLCDIKVYVDTINIR